MFLKSCISRQHGQHIVAGKTTLPDSWREFEVTSFAQTLVESGAACVQHKVSSTYKWEGQIQSDTEWALQIKVSNSNKQSVISKIEKNILTMCLKLLFMSVKPQKITPIGSIHNEWNERVQTGDPRPLGKRSLRYRSNLSAERFLINSIILK